MSQKTISECVLRSVRVPQAAFRDNCPAVLTFFLSVFLGIKLTQHNLTIVSVDDDEGFELYENGVI